MKRRLAAILAADIVGSSRLMARDDEVVLARIRELQTDILGPVISGHDGRIVKYLGDGALAEFPSVVNAVHAAIDILRMNAAAEAPRPEDDRLRLRIGVNLGDIIAESGDIYGDGVNVAARLEALADPDGLCISGFAHQGLGAARAREFTDCGPHSVKNIDHPVRVFRWRSSGTAPHRPRVHEVRPTISIAAFDRSAAQPDLAELADGLREDIEVAIGSVAQLTVVDEARTVEPPRYRLSGSVRGSGDRLRLQCKMVDQFSGIQVWAQRFDRPGGDLFEVQDDLAQTIVIDIHTTLGAGSYTNRWQQGTHNFEAWRLSARAFNEFQKYSPDAMELCIGIWTQALDRDPDFPTPRIARSYCRARIALWSPDRAEALLSAARADLYTALTACEADDGRPMSLLRAIRIAEGDHEGALDAARQGLAREPTNPATGATLAYALLMADHPEEALTEILKAAAEIPNYPGWFASIRILGHLFTGNLAAAREEAERTVARLPDFYTGRPLLAVCHVEAGAIEAARAVTAEIVARDPKFSTDTLVASLGLKNADRRDRLRDGLARAGL